MSASGFGRRSAAREVRGRGIQAAREHGHSASGARRVVTQFPHADRYVEVLADEIHEARGEIDLQRDRWVLEDELGEQRREDEVGHIARHRHTQAPARLDLPVLGE